MIRRAIENTLLDTAKQFPIISVTGPRQSGKTTIIKEVFKSYDYVNFEDLAFRNQAKSDPVAFLKAFKQNLIIDEAQYVPEIFSAVQVISDSNEKPGAFILSGSQNFLLSNNISQSLAGRVAVIKLLPLSFIELNNKYKKLTYKDIMLKGCYPRIYNSDLVNYKFYRNYIDTYISRDVKQILNLKNSTDFSRLLTILASRSGQLLNYASISKELSVDVRTIKSWISVLESSYIVYVLRPYYKNLTKSMVKSPKLYFYDTGLLCYLLNVKDDKDYQLKGFKGAIFENFVITELIKHYYNADLDSRISFYRDRYNTEIDIVDDSYDAKKIFYELKASETYQSKFLTNILKLANKNEIKVSDSCIVFGGTGVFTDNNVQISGFENWIRSL